MFLSPLVPLLDALLEDFEMFRVRHGRVTSLASGMLRMILPGPWSSFTPDIERAGGARLSGVQESCKSGKRFSAGVVFLPLPQRLKPVHGQILAAPLKRCSTLCTNGET